MNEAMSIVDPMIPTEETLQFKGNFDPEALKQKGAVDKIIKLAPDLRPNSDLSNDENPNSDPLTHFSINEIPAPTTSEASHRTIDMQSIDTPSIDTQVNTLHQDKPTGYTGHNDTDNKINHDPVKQEPAIYNSTDGLTRTCPAIEDSISITEPNGNNETYNPESAITTEDGSGIKYDKNTGLIRIKALSAALGALLLGAIDSEASLNKAIEYQKKQRGIEMAALAKTIETITATDQGEHHFLTSDKVISYYIESHPNWKNQSAEKINTANSQEYKNYRASLHNECKDKDTEATILKIVAKHVLETDPDPKDKIQNPKIGQTKASQATIEIWKEDITEELNKIDKAASKLSKSTYLKIMNEANSFMNKSSERALQLDMIAKDTSQEKDNKQVEITKSFTTTDPNGEVIHVELGKPTE